MLRIAFVTLFPETVLGAARHSISLRAEQDGLVQFEAVDPRSFTKDKHRTVDDKPFGGGPGMLMKPDIVGAALRVAEDGRGPDARAVVFPDPTGVPYSQGIARELSHKESIILVCGHYEGIDHRVYRHATHVLSIGDYVLSGGELPALVISDSVVRLLPGALGCKGSLEIDSHEGGLLSAPQYTRPESYDGEDVPEVLRSGNHEAVETWKRTEALKLTRRNRPDLFCRAKLEKRDLDLLSF